MLRLGSRRERAANFESRKCTLRCQIPHASVGRERASRPPHPFCAYASFANPARSPCCSQTASEIRGVARLRIRPAALSKTSFVAPGTRSPSCVQRQFSGSPQETAVNFGQRHRCFSLNHGRRQARAAQLRAQRHREAAQRCAAAIQFLGRSAGGRALKPRCQNE